MVKRSAALILSEGQTVELLGSGRSLASWVAQLALAKYSHPPCLHVAAKRYAQSRNVISSPYFIVFHTAYSSWTGIAGMRNHSSEGVPLSRPTTYCPVFRFGTCGLRIFSAANFALQSWIPHRPRPVDPIHGCCQKILPETQRQDKHYRKLEAESLHKNPSSKLPQRSYPRWLSK